MDVIVNGVMLNSRYTRSNGADQFGSTARGYSRGLCLVVWSLVGGLGLIDHVYIADDVTRPVFVLSGTTLLFGVWGFLHHGASQITAAGMFTASVGAFVGYAGLWWAYHGYVLPAGLVPAIAAAYYSTVLAYHLFWWATRRPVDAGMTSRSVSCWAWKFGAWLAAFSLIAYVAMPGSLRPAFEAGAVVGILLLAMGTVPGTVGGRMVVWRATILVASILLFVVLTFGGFGRLSVMTLGAGVAVIIADRCRTFTVKIGALIAVPVAAAGLTVLRFVRLRGAPPTAEQSSAPDSDVSGLWTLGRLVELRDGGSFGAGETFWATAVAWVPRTFWPEKPFGFGFELTLLLEPELAPYGHSMVATVFGEWFYNFGWSGFVFLVFMIGLSVRWIDRARAGFLRRRAVRRHDLLLVVLMTVLVASMLHLVWSGTHTLIARLMLPGAVLVGLLVFDGVRRALDDHNSRDERGQSEDALTADGVVTAESPPPIASRRGLKSIDG